MEKVDVGTGGANSQVREVEKLNETMERQRTEIARLRNLLDLTGAGKVLGFDFGSGFAFVITSSHCVCVLPLESLFNCYRSIPCLIYRAVTISLINKIKEF